jgi:aryl-alcohol dehydrogenase-like predicted oxidoreductase
MNRRRALGLLAGALVHPRVSAMAETTPLSSRLAVASGQRLPVVGLGTYQTFDVASNAPERSELKNVLATLVKSGGTVVDSSPMYGRAEGVVGELADELKLQSSLFLATKVWTRGAQAGTAQMEDSLRLLRTPRMDLMQVHNLVDWRTHLKTLQSWQHQGRIRHLGITHYHAGAYGELMDVMRTRAFAFVQFNYSVGEREAEERLLPLAAELGMGVLINRPFAQGGLFARVRGKPLPAWASEFDCTTWGQYFLKWILGHPAVTCVIPGTRRVSHLTDNLGAGQGRLPDAAQRSRMLTYLQTL